MANRQIIHSASELDRNDDDSDLESVKSQPVGHGSDLLPKKPPRPRSRVAKLEQVVTSNYVELNSQISGLTGMMENVQQLLTDKLSDNTVPNALSTQGHKQSSSANSSHKGKKKAAQSHKDKGNLPTRHKDDNGAYLTSHKDGYDNFRHQDDDVLSIHAGNDNLLSSPENSDDEGTQNDTNPRPSFENVFGEDSILPQKVERQGLSIEPSQLSVLDQSWHASEPNKVTSYKIDYKDTFLLDADTEKYLHVPELENLVDKCLKKHVGVHYKDFKQRKSRSLLSQPAKSVEKTAQLGQLSVKYGIAIMLYIQNALKDLMLSFDSDNTTMSDISKTVRDIFAMSTKCLDQQGRSGAYFHILRRKVTMSETGLWANPSSEEIRNMPLTSDGVLHKSLVDLLDEHKKFDEALNKVLPEKKIAKKRSSSSDISGASNAKKSYNGNNKASTSHDNRDGNFRIPKITISTKGDGKFRKVTESNSKVAHSSQKPAGRGRGSKSQ